MADQVFMCYARQDQDFVLELAGALKAQGVPVWIDQWDIPGSADWDMAIEEALPKSSHMVVVLSPASMKSGEVRSEWRAALQEGKPIVPVLFQTCRIHRRLQLIQHIDFISRPPTDATAVGEIVSALGMEGRAAEKEESPTALSADTTGGSGSAADLPAGEPSENICPFCKTPYVPGEAFCEECGSYLAPPPPVLEPKICLACKAENPPDSVFCDNCGASLPPPAPEVQESSGNICPACEARNVPGEPFCDFCGTALSSAPSA